MQLQEKLKQVTPGLVFKRKEIAMIQEKWKARWAQLNTPLHACAYALDPEFLWVKDDIFKNAEISKGCSFVIDRLGKSTTHKTRLDAALLNFRNKVGEWSSKNVKRAVQNQTMSSAQLWQRYGGCEGTKRLRKIAIRILSQVSTSSACERSWSTFEFIHSKKRNRLSADKCADLVWVHSNLRLARKLNDPDYVEEILQWEALDME